jgi:D-arginine dehydrogenase
MDSVMLTCDFLIVGAGIAGAGVAYHLAGDASVVLIDMEAQPGYHTTGRSAAFYAETYGGPVLQPLTSASKSCLLSPPSDFSDVPILTNLGAMHIYGTHQQASADQAYKEMAAELPGVRLLAASEVLERAPFLKPEKIAGAIDDPDCGNLDVAALHQGFLRGAKKAGAQVLLEAGFESASFDGQYWLVQTRTGEVKAKTIVNAAGAWADEIASRAGVRPLGMTPLRRTIVKIPNPDSLPYIKDGPVIIDVDEDFYFKPEGAGYLVSPADEIPCAACDAQPELEDIAVAADYFEKATGATVETLEAKWAGLRTFAPDRKPVIGFASDNASFFWNVGQGGYGIQTAPAWSELAAALARGEETPAELAHHKVKAALYSPARFD